MNNSLLVAGFGMIGVLSRYYIGVVTSRYLPLPSHFPLATLLINILGAFLIGVVYSLSSRNAFFSPAVTLGVIVGFLGGFTTFSTFCMETLKLLEKGEYLTGGLYFIGSPVLGLAACYSGMLLIRSLLGVNDLP